MWLIIECSTKFIEYFIQCSKIIKKSAEQESEKLKTILMAFEIIMETFMPRLVLRKFYNFIVLCTCRSA